MTIVNIEEYQSHKVSEVICVKCGKRWIAVRPSITKLKDLECPICGAGYVIETGENIKTIEGEQ
jgi:DNA-directed RNA polymerase subunit RPC12/RpoP